MGDETINISATKAGCVQKHATHLMEDTIQGNSKVVLNCRPEIFWETTLRSCMPKSSDLTLCVVHLPAAKCQYAKM